MSFFNLDGSVRAPNQMYDNNDTSNKVATCAFVRTALNTVDNSLNTLTNVLLLKADKSYVDASLNLRASQSYVDASLNLRASQSYVDASLNTLNSAISVIDASINTIITDISNLSVNNNNSSSGITLDDTVLQIAIEGMRDLPLFAQNWQQITSINYTLNGSNCSNSIATSGNGQYIFVGLQGTSVANTVPQLSKDYGNTWSSVTPAFGQTFENATAAAISATGQYMIAINTANGVSTSSGIFLSSNYGSTWTRGPASGTSTDSVAISSTGKYMLSATSVYLTISDNYGMPREDETTSWYNGNSLFIDPSNSNFRGRFHAVAMSHDGAVMYSTTHYRVWKSVDYGQTWAQSNGTGANYGHISCSANGQYVLICPYQTSGDVSNNLFVSSDYGVTFTAKGDIHSYYQGSVSACGRYMVAADGGRYSGPMTFRKGYLYASSDYGQTWEQVNNTLGYYTGITMSHSGNMVYTQSSTMYGDSGKLYVNNANYSSCIQTNQPYGTVPGGTIYYDQSNNEVMIYNSRTSTWYSLLFVS